jgi:hypothetical protein
MRRTLIILSALALAAALAWYLWPSDQARIEKLVRETARAVQEEDVAAVMSGVSFNYRDDYGMSYLLVKRALEERFRRFSEIVVEYEGLSIEVAGDKAVATLGIRVIASLGSSRGYYLGDVREPVRLRLDLEKGPSRKWLVTKAAWGPRGGRQMI